MTAITIYHNPRCSKSRQTLELIRAAGHDPEVVLYLQNPPAPKTLEELCRLLAKEPLEVMRIKEARFRELGLSKSDQRGRKEWLELIHHNPMLLERPIVVRGKRAVIGRPPENVSSLL